MNELLKYLETVIDTRQEKKVRHKIKDIVIIVFFAMLAGADEWTEYEIFGREHEKFLRVYLELSNGIPSHDTIQRVFAMLAPESLQRFRAMWNGMINSNEGEKIKKILSIDGKTQRGNGNKNQKANHIVSAVDENGFCLGEERVDEKSNEITAIPDLLDNLNVKGHIITTDAMGTQREIVKKIRQKKADYVLALKGNQGTLHEDVALYFGDPELLAGCAYKKTVEKARGGIERREYWQTDDISWLSQKKEWAGLKSIAMTKNTVIKNGKESVETRYFISSLPKDINEVSRAVRGHWAVESCHWHLDVTFHEDDSRTVEKQAAFNQNILRKLALNVLKIFETGKKKLSTRMKRFSVSTNPEKHLQSILDM
jgi:predicted transposase YbfD/YdcC